MKTKQTNKNLRSFRLQNQERIKIIRKAVESFVLRNSLGKKNSQGDLEVFVLPEKKEME